MIIVYKKEQFIVNPPISVSFVMHTSKRQNMNRIKFHQAEKHVILKEMPNKKPYDLIHFTFV